MFLIPLILLLVLDVAMDLGIHFALKRHVKSTGKGKWLLPTIDIINVCALIMLTVVVLVDFNILWKMWMLYGFLTVFFAEFVGCLVALIGRLPRLLRRPAWRHFGTAGIIVGGIVFVLMWYGALVTRLSPHVEEVTVDIPGLPAEFDGYRIVQLSDLHVGTYGKDATFPTKIVETVNGLHPDLIVFTGDLVNSRASDLEPFTGILSQLKAADGVISILGNHDYGDYSHWENEQKKLNDRAWLHTMQREMGWKLLCDSTATIARGNDSIYIVGVENIGEPPFTAYGSLTRAATTTPRNGLKILLTHNPRHWNDSVMNRKEMEYALTLSGHTHAMQMRLGHWSPSKYKYPQWSGLYTDTLGRHLYVNIGAGTVGMPARFGNAYPEITVLTLRGGNKSEKKK